MESIRENVPGEVDSIDRKTMRGAKDTGASKNIPHIVSAWAVANGLCLGQVRVNEKSNEITAVYEKASRKRKNASDEVIYPTFRQMPKV